MRFVLYIDELSRMQIIISDSWSGRLGLTKLKMNALNESMKKKTVRWTLLY